MNFDYRNLHEGYSSTEYESEHFIKITKNRAKTQRHEALFCESSWGEWIGIRHGEG